MSISSKKLVRRIEAAFSARQAPDAVLNIKPGQDWFDSDEKDTLWFHQREWRSISIEEWDRRHFALSFFTPEALAYYLPSIMLHSILAPGECLTAVSSVIYTLSSNSDSSKALNIRYMVLNREERSVLKEWILMLFDNPAYGYRENAGELLRAVATLDSLAGEGI